MNVRYKEIFDSLGEDLQMKLDHIRRFLCAGNASVMVGAGFSRNAESIDGDSMADWNSLANTIYDELHPKLKNNRVLDFITPIRLASEYATSFSRRELDILIERVLPDGNMKPSELHKTLLNLPWKDVFTTNYDTLLERTLQDTNRSYSLVTNKSTLVFSKSPRIIKLHGSMPDIHPYIMTEEDYRTYPNKYPEFVNTVRQSLIENMFCLIGFSGDDPNFLSWIGWLKDVIGRDHSSVYLITFDKEMKYTYKYLFAERNIKIVNLAETKPGMEVFESYRDALEFFLTYIGKKDESKLEEWDCEVKIDWRKKENVDVAIEAMEKKRLKYPGWIILPTKYFNKFTELDDYIPYGKGFPDGLTQEQRIKLMYELDFRLNITLSPKVIEWYKEELEDLRNIDRKSSGEDFIKVTALLVSLLSIYREEEDLEKFDSLEKQLLQNVNYMNGETKNRFQYERCLMNLYKLDYGKVRLILRDWNVEASCYKAMLWKACITAEINKPQEAEYQLSLCRDFIRTALGHNSSKSYVLTESQKIVAWMNTIYAYSYTWSNELKRQSRQNRENLFHELLRKFNEEIKKEQHPQVEYISGFNIGDKHTRWNSQRGAYINEFLYSYKMMRLFDEVGHPFGFPRVSVDKEELKTAFTHLYKYKPVYVVNNMVRTFDKSHVDLVMDKDAIRLLDANGARKWVETRLKNAEEWINTDDKQIEEKIKLSLLHIMVRLCSLLDEASILRVFKIVLKVEDAWFLSDKIKLLKLMCDYMDNKILEQTVVPAMLESEIQDHWDFEFPEEDLNIGQISQKAIDIIINGFKSDNESLQRKAYERTDYLKRHNANLEALSSVLREWRNEGNPLSTYKLHSYNILEYNKEQDKVNPKDLLSQVSVKLKADSEVKTNGGSPPIQQVTNDLRNVLVLLQYADGNQMGQILAYVGNFLSLNKNILLKDSSKEMMGGLRHFTNQLFDVFSDMVRQLYSNAEKANFTSLDKDEVGKVCDMLEEYYSAGFKISNMLLRLCQIAGRDFSHKDNMVNWLTSNDKSKRVDACNMLLYFSRKGEDISTELDKLLAYSEICQDERIEEYLKVLCDLVEERLIDDNSLDRVALLLNNIKENISGFRCLGNSKSNILYYACRIAGALEGCDKNGKFGTYTSKWRDMHKDGWGLNDEQKGYVHGLQNALRTANKNLNND